MNNKRSYTEYTVTTPTTVFTIGFEDTNDSTKDTIIVTLNGVRVESLGYAVMRTNDQTITITPAITSGTVRLQRETDIDKSYHQFTAGALFSAKSMDENLGQIRASQQEVRDGFVFLEYNTNGIVSASKEATAQAKAATVVATTAANRAEASANEANAVVDAFAEQVAASIEATEKANTATTNATAATVQATTATTAAQQAAANAVAAQQAANAAASTATTASNNATIATEAANEAAEVVANLVLGKVRAQDVTTSSGGTQEGFNTELTTAIQGIMGQVSQSGIRYLTAKAMNMITWDAIPDAVPAGGWTDAVYLAVFQNNLNFAKALRDAAATGACHIIIERANYPMTYKHTGTREAPNYVDIAHAIIDVPTPMSVDMNGSVFFTLFDSDRRSPLHLAEGIPPCYMAGCLFGFDNTTYFSMFNGEVRGDMYFRRKNGKVGAAADYYGTGQILRGGVLTTVYERDTEQTYGFMYGDNNVGLDLSRIRFHGFRGDGMSGGTRISYFTQTGDMKYWNKGSVNRTTGAIDYIDSTTGLPTTAGAPNAVVVQLEGAYHSQLFNFTGKVFKRNAIQMVTNGILKAIQFRSDTLEVFFYDATGAFLMYEVFRQTDNIYMPRTATQVRIVAYGDERTADRVEYGDYIYLTTGISQDIKFSKCEFFNNHRGGVSNIMRIVSFDDCDFHDLGGSTKYGNPRYYSTTLYGINVEDLYGGSVIVTNCRFRNVPNPVQTNVRNLTWSGGLVQDCTFTGAFLSSTVRATIDDVHFDNLGASVIAITPLYVNVFRKRNIKFTNNIVSRCAFYTDISTQRGMLLEVSDNQFYKSKVDVIGNGRNLIVRGNTYEDFYRKGLNYNFRIRGAWEVFDNKMISTADGDYDTRTAGGQFLINSTLSGTNSLMLEQVDQRFCTPVNFMTDDTIVHKGLQVIGNGGYITAIPTATRLLSGTSGTWTPAHIDKVNFESMQFSNCSLLLGTVTTETGFCPAESILRDCIFDKGSELQVTRRESVTGSTMNIYVYGGVFDLSTATCVLNMVWELTLGTLNVYFSNTTFKSDTVRSLPFLKGYSKGVTLNFDANCRYINVTNTTPAAPPAVP